MRLAFTLAACLDCVSYVNSGDIPEDRPTLPIEIADHLQLAPNQTLVYAAGLDENGNPDSDGDGDWFSWVECDCCGDFHGGMRNRLAVLENNTETDNERKVA